MNYENLCQNIIDFDSKIRFCGITNTKSEIVASINRDSEDKMLKDDEIQMSIHYTLDRWSKATNLSYRIGNEKSATIEYDKVTLITIPISGSELLLISTEPNAEYAKIIEYATKQLKE
ncbi:MULTISPECIES: hypothetical protein [Nitrosopumilus]|uniref:Roadblock/LAMTOR2 domain-containing protein n=1 Tax=Nitrosopumilus piranensis TaxID=1582439 RepID=A0A0C5BVN6_9ARCH|nr:MULTISPECIES: hypothetical protein [Nitrosopumilus]AJM92309.1 hypothetical protein NPIRD3C_1097 [Nitrosopumilus piranensis]KAF6244250.1 hypothetical protein C6989_08105 [Nitrosopumilus sp. b2]